MEVILHQGTMKNKRKQEFCFKRPKYVGSCFDAVGIFQKFGAKQKVLFNSRLFFEGDTVFFSFNDLNKTEGNF